MVVIPISHRRSSSHQASNEIRLRSESQRSPRIIHTRTHTHARTRTCIIHTAVSPSRLSACLSHPFSGRIYRRERNSRARKSVKIPGGTSGKREGTAEVPVLPPLPPLRCLSAIHPVLLSPHISMSATGPVVFSPFTCAEGCAGQGGDAASGKKHPGLAL